MATSNANLEIDDDALADFCRRHHIRRLALFGSVLRPDFRRDSDVDVLVEFEAGYVPGFGFIALQDELSDLLGRQVDLETPNSLSVEFRDVVVSQAEVRYAASSTA
jgi:uncharacterized protein